MLTYDINMDVTPGSLPKVLHVKQYQTDALFKFKLYSRNGELSIGNVTDCSIRGTKSDGNGYSVNATYNSSTTTVSAYLDSQMTARSGKQPFELTLTDSSGKMITATFWLDVQRAAFDMDTPSASPIRELIDALDHTDEILQAYNEASYDDVPTIGSVHAVKSDGVKRAIDEASEEVADLKSALSDMQDEIEAIVPWLSEEAKEALLACFAHVYWTDDDQDYYGALVAALETEPEEYTGSIISLGNILNGATIKSFGSALGVYAEDTSKTAMTSDYVWEFPTGYILTTQDGVLHISGEYTGSSTSIGGYIKDGSFSTSQSAADFDPLIEDDGQDYTVTIYARNLKAGQNLDVRFRTIGTGSATKYHTTEITPSAPFFKKTFTAEEISEYGGDLGIGIYYYFGTDKTFDDSQIYITVSTSDNAGQYVYAASGNDQLTAMTNCLVVSDNVVTITKNTDGVEE